MTLPIRTVLVTGGSGQLAAGIIDEFAGAVETIIPVDIDVLDIGDAAAVRDTIGAARPDCVINCAAWNDVDGAEEHPLPALKTNALAVASLANACARAQAVFVHYSTDFVFAGDGARPYTEEDRPSPLSVYGMSKLLGEMLVAHLPDTYVLRLESLFGGRRTRSTIDGILASIDRGEDTRVFADRVATPSYVPDVARATRHLILSRAPAGIYHAVNSGAATWLEIAHEIARMRRAVVRIVPISTAEVLMRAVRPRYCALSNAKLASAGMQMPHWKDALARHCKCRTAGASLC